MAKIKVDDAVNEYMRHLEIRKLRPGTTRGARSALEQLARVSGNIWIDKIDSRIMDRVFATYPWQASTVNNKLRLFHTFFKWVRDRRYAAPDWNPLIGWRRVSVPDKQRTRIPQDRWGMLFDQCVHPQERIILGTGLYLFLRASEQQTIQVKHVSLQKSEIEIWRTKTQEWDVMPISVELDEIMRSHLKWLASLGAADPEHFLIPARNRDLERENNRWVAGTGSIDPTRPLTHPHRAVQRILKRTGYFIRGEGEHTLRRSGARAYYDELVGASYDGALRRVQSMLGHKFSVTTEMYLGLDLERHARNKELRGNPMFPSAAVRENVVPIFREKSWQNRS